MWLVGTRRGGSQEARNAGLDYDASVEEALCFGWIDGQAARLDDQRSKQYFAPRRSGSPWARTNKVRIHKMLAAGLMTPAGLAVIERTQLNDFAYWRNVEARVTRLLPVLRRNGALAKAPQPVPTQNPGELVQ